MTKQIRLQDATQDHLTSLDDCVLGHKNKHVVLLTQCEIRRKDLEIPPPQVIMFYRNSSSRSDSRGILCSSHFSCLVCQLVYLNTYSNYRLHLLSMVRPQITLTQVPHILAQGGSPFFETSFFFVLSADRRSVRIHNN